MPTSSEQNGRDPLAGLTRDDIEGEYAQKDPAVGHVRTVHGQYTESAGHPDPLVEGTYVGAAHDGIPPLVRPSQLRHGNYPKAEHGRVEHGHEHEHGHAEH